MYLLLFYYNQQMYNCLIKVYIRTVYCVINTATCFDTIVSSSDSLQPMPCYVTHIGYKLPNDEKIVSKYVTI